MPGGVSMITPAWRLWLFIRPCRASSFRPMRPVCDTLPVVFRFCDYAPTASLWIRYAPSIEVEAFASVILLLISPSAVRSHRAIKREEPHHVGAVRFFYKSSKSVKTAVFFRFVYRSQWYSGKDISKVYSLQWGKMRDCKRLLINKITERVYFHVCFIYVSPVNLKNFISLYFNVLQNTQTRLESV